MRTRAPSPIKWLVYLLVIVVAIVAHTLRSRLTLGAGLVMIWVVVSAFIIVRTFKGIERRRNLQRLYAGQCVGCGYDLRGSPGRCPECGMVPDKEQAAYLKT